MSEEEPQGEIACFCNNVSKTKVKEAIALGAKTLPKIYDACGAGTGPCGGTCQPLLTELLKEEQGKESPKEDHVPDALIHGVSLFNRHYFWECHEVLEHEWMDEHGPKKIFYQGIIQASAAFYHVLNANPQGVIRLAREARNKLQPYAPIYLKLAVSPLIDSLLDFERQSKEILGGSLAGFEYDKIPKLKLGSGT